MSAPTYRESVAAGCVMAVLALCMFILAQQLDDSGIASEVEIAQAIEEEAAALASREFVAQQICGVEATPRWKGDELTCLTHRGHPASRQVVAGVKP